MQVKLWNYKWQVAPLFAATVSLCQLGQGKPREKPWTYLAGIQCGWLGKSKREAELLWWSGTPGGDWELSEGLPWEEREARDGERERDDRSICRMSKWTIWDLIIRNTNVFMHIYIYIYTESKSFSNLPLDLQSWLKKLLVEKLSEAMAMIRGGYKQQMEQRELQQQGQQQQQQQQQQAGFGAGSSGGATERSELGKVLLEKWCWGNMSLPLVQALAQAGVADGLSQPLIRPGTTKNDSHPKGLLSWFSLKSSPKQHYWCSFGAVLVHFFENCTKSAPKVHHVNVIRCFFFKKIPCSEATCISWISWTISQSHAQRHAEDDGIWCTMGHGSPQPYFLGVAHWGCRGESKVTLDGEPRPVVHIG